MASRRPDLPSFKIVDTAVADTEILQLHVYVLMAPADMPRAGAVALQVTKDHIQQASTDDENDVVATYISSDAAQMKQESASPWALYVADRVPEHHRPSAAPNATETRMEHGSIWVLAGWDRP